MNEAQDCQLHRSVVSRGSPDCVCATSAHVSAGDTDGISRPRSQVSWPTLSSPTGGPTALGQAPARMPWGRITPHIRPTCSMCSRATSISAHPWPLEHCWGLHRSTLGPNGRAILDDESRVALRAPRHGRTFHFSRTADGQEPDETRRLLLKDPTPWSTQDAEHLASALRACEWGRNRSRRQGPHRGYLSRLRHGSAPAPRGHLPEPAGSSSQKAPPKTIRRSPRVPNEKHSHGSKSRRRFLAQDRWLVRAYRFRVPMHARFG